MAEGDSASSERLSTCIVLIREKVGDLLQVFAQFLTKSGEATVTKHTANLERRATKFRRHLVEYLSDNFDAAEAHTMTEGLAELPQSELLRLYMDLSKELAPHGQKRKRPNPGLESSAEDLAPFHSNQSRRGRRQVVDTDDE